jgi:hypothetical protein
MLPILLLLSTFAVTLGFIYAIDFYFYLASCCFSTRTKGDFSVVYTDSFFGFGASFSIKNGFSVSNYLLGSSISSSSLPSSITGEYSYYSSY